MIIQSNNKFFFVSFILVILITITFFQAGNKESQSDIGVIKKMTTNLVVDDSPYYEVAVVAPAPHDVLLQENVIGKLHFLEHIMLGSSHVYKNYDGYFQYLNRYNIDSFNLTGPNGIQLSFRVHKQEAIEFLKLFSLMFSGEFTIKDINKTKNIIRSELHSRFDSLKNKAFHKTLDCHFLPISSRFCFRENLEGHYDYLNTPAEVIQQDLKELFLRMFCESNAHAVTINVPTNNQPDILEIIALPNKQLCQSQIKKLANGLIWGGRYSLDTENKLSGDRVVTKIKGITIRNDSWIQGEINQLFRAEYQSTQDKQRLFAVTPMFECDSYGVCFFIAYLDRANSPNLKEEILARYLNTLIKFMEHVSNLYSQGYFNRLLKERAKIITAGKTNAVLLAELDATVFSKQVIKTHSSALIQQSYMKNTVIYPVVSKKSIHDHQFEEFSNVLSFEKEPEIKNENDAKSEFEHENIKPKETKQKVFSDNKEPINNVSSRIMEFGFKQSRDIKLPIIKTDNLNVWQEMDYLFDVGIFRGRGNYTNIYTVLSFNTLIKETQQCDVQNIESIFQQVLCSNDSCKVENKGNGNWGILLNGLPANVITNGEYVSVFFSGLYSESQKMMILDYIVELSHLTETDKSFVDSNCLSKDSSLNIGNERRAIIQSQLLSKAWVSMNNRNKSYTVENDQRINKKRKLQIDVLFMGSLEQNNLKFLQSLKAHVDEISPKIGMRVETTLTNVALPYPKSNAHNLVSIEITLEGLSLHERLVFDLFEYYWSENIQYHLRSQAGYSYLAVLDGIYATESDYGFQVYFDFMADKTISKKYEAINSFINSFSSLNDEEYKEFIDSYYRSLPQREKALKKKLYLFKTSYPTLFEHAVNDENFTDQYIVNKTINQLLKSRISISYYQGKYESKVDVEEVSNHGI